MNYRERMAAEAAEIERLKPLMSHGWLNLTPHAIGLRLADGTTVTVAPSGELARVATVEVAGEAVGGMSTVYRRLGAAEGLPLAGVPCLVSALVLGACPGREGVYAPDTGPTAIRENGLVVAVTRLVRA